MIKAAKIIKVSDVLVRCNVISKQKNYNFVNTFLYNKGSRYRSNNLEF